MYLNKIDLGRKVKCKCDRCRGTGVYKDFLFNDDLGVICSNCNGKGYETFELEENMEIFYDDETKTYYLTKKGIIITKIEIFKKLEPRTDIKYVVYAVGIGFLPELISEKEEKNFEIITYNDFYINRKLPLPMKKYTCPRYILQTYRNSMGVHFDNGCVVPLFEACQKFGEETSNCWELFYEGAQTIEEKHAVLNRKINDK